MTSWSNNHFHSGLGSSSRVEGAHSMGKLWLQTSAGTPLDVFGALQIAYKKKSIEIIKRISKELTVLVNNFPPHICTPNGEVSHYALQMAFEYFKTKFPPNEKFTNK
ncbi:hypothetical protein O181_095408 [Austropuccinia psidii MF-1]|uniref:Uncharacterized protein n=1 Tax=Austropuccinia psidii MF-1 TaxID=1389203 RepID=A0A9Q3PB65_9BASI|nr:hypothetical protein [Austropuccinia psidii MF-1]